MELYLPDKTIPVKVFFRLRILVLFEKQIKLNNLAERSLCKANSEDTTNTGKIFEKNFSFHVKQRTMGKV